MSDFCIVCTPRSGSYYVITAICQTFGLVNGNEWFGRNKKVDLTKPAELSTAPVDIDWTVNEDLLNDREINLRLNHLQNFPAPYCIKAMPLQFSNTVTRVNLRREERLNFAYKFLSNFSLIWFQQYDKISHFCFEITAMACSQKDYPRNREYSTYDPEKRTVPPPNSFTATEKDFDRYIYRELFTNEVMSRFANTPIIVYENFIKDQEGEIEKLRIALGNDTAGVSFNTKKKVIKMPDYKNIFTNYTEIEDRISFLE